MRDDLPSPDAHDRFGPAVWNDVRPFRRCDQESDQVSRCSIAYHQKLDEIINANC